MSLMDRDNPQHSHDASSGWQFEPSDTLTPGAKHSPAPSVPAHTAHMPHEQGVAWSASEFIAHQKSFGWYALLVVVAAAVAALVYLLTKDKISTGAVIFVAMILGITAARKPRTLRYELTDVGIGIGSKFYDYGQFRSFAIVDEGAFSSLVFMPLRRFMPLITVYYEPQDEDKIVGMLAERLPMEEHQLDLMERLMRRIRF